MATHLACSNLYMLFDTIKRGLELSQSANILRIIRCNVQGCWESNNQRSFGPTGFLTLLLILCFTVFIDLAITVCFFYAWTSSREDR